MIEKALLPNIRWLALPSVGLGEDWVEKVLKIDHDLESLGYELAEESVYLLYSHSAREILLEKGHCLIARPVLGPKKMLEAPFLLKDWIASEVWKAPLRGVTLEELLGLVAHIDQKRELKEKQLERGFILCIRRRLVPGLSVTIEVIFPE